MVRRPVAHARTCGTLNRQMEKWDGGVSREQTALGLIQIIQVGRVAARRRGEYRLWRSHLLQPKLTRRFAKRCGWIGARQNYPHQADVFHSRLGYLHVDAKFAGVESKALGDQLGLRVSRIIS